MGIEESLLVNGAATGPMLALLHASSVRYSWYRGVKHLDRPHTFLALSIGSEIHPAVLNLNKNPHACGLRDEVVFGPTAAAAPCIDWFALDLIILHEALKSGAQQLEPPAAPWKCA